jgi:hypothetical protein
MAEDPLREMVLEEDFKRAVIGLDAIEIKMVVGQVCALCRETDNMIIASVDPNFVSIEIYVKIRTEWDHIVKAAEVMVPYIVPIEWMLCGSMVGTLSPIIGFQPQVPVRIWKDVSDIDVYRLVISGDTANPCDTASPIGLPTTTMSFRCHSQGAPAAKFKILLF